MRKLHYLTSALAAKAAGSAKMLATGAMLLLAGATAVAASPNAPYIYWPAGESGAAVISGLSNNGAYGVATVQDYSDSETGSSEPVGAVVYDMTAHKSTTLTPMRSRCSANDVTNDGSIVVGSLNGQPAVARRGDNGSYSWNVINYNKGDKITYFSYVDEVNRTVTISGGTIRAVTPDGKYAVGTVTTDQDMNFERGMMWDLEKNEVIDLPVRLEDAGWPMDLDGSFRKYTQQTRFDQISDDGRYILVTNGFSFTSTVMFVYDRQEQKEIYINYTDGDLTQLRNPGYGELSMPAPTRTMSPNGQYVVGAITKLGTESTRPFMFNVTTGELKVYDDAAWDGYVPYAVNSNGMMVVSNHMIGFDSDAYVLVDDYLFPLRNIYQDAYGMNLNSNNLEYTGIPTLISEDGKTIVCVTYQTQTYAAQFKESINDAVERLDLLGSYSVNPASGIRMAQVRSIDVSFDFPISVDGSRSKEVQILDKNGNVVRSALSGSGVSAIGNTMTLTFMVTKLEEDQDYTVKIPAEIAWVTNHPSSKSPEIVLSYTGRDGTKPAKVETIYPASGASLPNLDINDNPVMVTFDIPVYNATDMDNRKFAHLYVDDNQEPYATLYIDVDTYTHRMLIFPPATLPLYKNSEYRIEVPAGAVGDVSGGCLNEAFTINYSGSYVPELGDGQFLFKSDCDNYENLIFYEGDHGEPVAPYNEWGFTADTTPWSVVAEDESSADMAFLSHSCYEDGRQADDWVILPQLKIPSDTQTVLTFDGQGYKKNKQDYLKVYVYESNIKYNQQMSADVIADIRANGDLIFNEIMDPGASEAYFTGDWTHVVLDLTKYAGKNIYICFVNDNQNQSAVIIDNIRVMQNMDAYITITGQPNVVAKDSAPVKGILSVVSELETYNSLTMNLLDGSGNTVSTISENRKFASGDNYNFEFPKELPLELGKENAYTIEYYLDDTKLSHDGVIRNLMFEPLKRIVIEEVTGRDCQFCPEGHAMMEILQSRYGQQIVPVALHCYNGSDPKGTNMLSYVNSVFGSTSAPQARVNRRSITGPMVSDGTNFYESAANFPGVANTWLDEVVEELAIPTYMEMELIPNDINSFARVNYTVNVKSALDLKAQNIRVLAMLLEDGLVDYQVNGVYSNASPLLGEWGRGGKYAQATVYPVTFHNVARGYWGESVNGAAYGSDGQRLIPNNLTAGETYSFEIEMNVPNNVEDLQKCKLAVILLDENNNNKVVNAAVKVTANEVEEIIDELGGALALVQNGSEIIASAAGDLQVAVFSLDGRMLRMESGNGLVSIDLGDYQGMVIVKATANGQTVTGKFMN